MRVLAAALGVSLLSSVTYGQLAAPPVPPENPITVAKTNLGKVLFWDEQLSSTRTISCGTCHIPEAGGADPRSVLPESVHPGPDGVLGTGDDVAGSLGVPRNNSDGTYAADPLFGLHVQVTGRRAPTAINAGYSSTLFWDGRATDTLIDPITGQVVIPSGAALETQALGPPVSDVEMAHVGRGWQDVLDRIEASVPLALSDDIPPALVAWINGRSYEELFDGAFGTPDITASRVAMAIATYERTLLANQTPWDAVIAAGSPIGILTPQEIQGFLVFVDVVTGQRCDECHGPNIVALSDNDFHYIGLRPADEDPGRFAVTGDPQDLGAMKTPRMRNVELRSPFFHNGSMTTLEEVVEFYDRGGDFAAPNLAISPLGLTQQQKRDLVVFLKRPLTDPRVAAGLPPFDRPSQYADSGHVPVTLGQGTPGTAGHVPSMIAIEPPKIGNPNMTVAVADALGGAPAVLLASFAKQVGPFPASNRPVLAQPTAIAAIPALMGSGAGGGYGSIVLHATSNPSLVGSMVFLQWLVLDPGGSGSIALSPFAQLTWF